MGVDFAKYRKFVVAGSGALILILSQIVGLNVDDSTTEDVLNVFDGLVAIATAFGVKAVKNAE